MFGTDKIIVSPPESPDLKVVTDCNRVMCVERTAQLAEGRDTYDMTLSDLRMKFARRKRTSVTDSAPTSRLMH